MKRILITALGMALLTTTALHAEPGKHKQERRHIKDPRVKAHIEQQRSENKAFRESIRELSPAEKAQATIGHRQTQYGENVTFRDQIYQERLVKTQERLANNEHLTKSEKAEILSFWENQHQTRSDYRTQKHAENMGVLQQVASNPEISPEEAKSLLKGHFQTQRQESQQFRQNLRQEARVKRQAIRERVQEQNSVQE